MLGDGAASGYVQSPIGLLVIRALLARLSGTHQSDLAFSALQRISGTMDLEKIAQTVGKDPENMQEVRPYRDHLVNPRINSGLLDFGRSGAFSSKYATQPKHSLAPPGYGSSADIWHFSPNCSYALDGINRRDKGRV